MSHESLEVRPSSVPRRVIGLDTRVLTVPDDWDLLPPGDAALSRRIKEDGPSWTVIEPKSMSDTLASVSGFTIVACAWTGPLLTGVGAAFAAVAPRAATAAAPIMP